MPKKEEKTTPTKRLARENKHSKQGRGQIITGQAGKAAAALKKRQKMLQDI